MTNSSSTETPQWKKKPTIKTRYMQNTCTI